MRRLRRDFAAQGSEHLCYWTSEFNIVCHLVHEWRPFQRWPASLLLSTPRASCPVGHFLIQTFVTNSVKSMARSVALPLLGSIDLGCFVKHVTGSVYGRANPYALFANH